MVVGTYVANSDNPKLQTKMKHFNVSMAILMIAIASGCASKSSQALLQSRAKVSQVDAIKVALARIPNGTVKDTELEEENGRLIWSFDFATPGTGDITEVQIDAITGLLVTVEVENSAQQAEEAAAKLREKKHH
jgi:uncharacterized membrane protein YkoI